MGVIDLYSKIKDIVGHNWDGKNLELSGRTVHIIDHIPDNVLPAVLKLNSNGFYFQLQRKVGDEWENVAGQATGTGLDYYSSSLPQITETSLCRFVVRPYGFNETLYSNEFTVTRTAAQASAMKMDTQAITDDITVEKEDITPVTEKVTATTTKSK